MSEQTLTGLELRKAVLEAAGWVVTWMSATPRIFRYILINPDGEKAIETSFLFDPNRDGFDSEADAWQRGPAVESSVDAALRWLTLPEGLRWEINGPYTDGQYFAAITQQDGFWVADSAYVKDCKNGGASMCYAYLVLRGGI